MITVQLNEPNFEYDIHSLVKAFYPQHDVLVKAMPREEFPESVFHLVVNYDRKNHMIDFKFFEHNQKETQEEDDAAKEETVAQDHENRAMKEKMALDGSVQVDFEDRKKTKNELKQQLYYLLTVYAGKTLPWGTLTGIRPTKIPMELLEEGKSEDEIRSYMKETYLASDEKIELSLSVAKRELELLSRIDYENGYSLYVGIPFCPSTCLYCSFTSYPLAKWVNRMDEYLDALEKEIAFTAEVCKHKVLNSVYIGGGTPTTLSAEQMDRLLTMIGSYFGIADEQGRMIYADEHVNEIDVIDEAQLLRNHVDGVEDGGHVHPDHGDDTQNVFQIPEIDRNGGGEHCHAQRQKILHDHDDWQTEQRQRIDGDTCHHHDGDDDAKAEQHVDKAACDVGDGDDLSGEVDLFHQILLSDHGAGTAGDGGGEEDPRHQCHK